MVTSGSRSGHEEWRDALLGEHAYDKALPGFGSAGRVRHRALFRLNRTEDSNRSEDSLPSLFNL